MKIIYQLSLLLIVYIGTNFVCYANSVVIYDEEGRNFDIQESVIKSKIDIIQQNYGLDIDVVVLGLDNKGCYKEINIDTCVMNQYGYVSDVLISIRKKLSDEYGGAIRGLISTKFDKIINNSDLKTIQDSTLFYFKKEDLQSGIIDYLDRIGLFIDLKCTKIRQQKSKLYYQVYDKDLLTDKNCNVNELIKELDNIKELQTKYEEKQAKQGFYYFIGAIIFLIIVYISLQYVIRYRFTKKIKNLLKDVKYYRIDLRADNLYFEKDKQELLNKIHHLEEKVELYLGNFDKSWKLLKKKYEQFALEKEELLKRSEKVKLDFGSQKKLEGDINEFKNLDL